MILDVTQAKAIIKKPVNAEKIEEVKQQESQLRVYTEDLTEARLKTETYWGKLLLQMENRSSKKYDRVLQFARYPLPVVQLSDSLLNDFYKVFDGKNRNFDIEGDRDINALEEWLIKNQIEKWIEKEAREVYKNKPNTFVVIDRDDKGEPIIVLVDSNRLIDAKFKNPDGQLDYICFVHSQQVSETNKDEIITFYSVYDDENYYVFSKSSKEDEIKEVSQAKHQIGYCPAKSFIKTPTTTANEFKRRAAFSSALAKFEDWTLFDIYRNYVDHYAPFPVTEAPVKKCGNPHCNDGVVMEEVIDKLRPGQFKHVPQKCPICKGEDDGKHIMPGTHIGIQVKEDKNAANGSNVFRMIFPESDKLKYVPEKLDGLELEIRYKTVGVNAVLNNEAVNELQVKGSFATMESILLRTKDELDALYIWIAQTVALLYYKDISLNIEANFGTEFYLATEAELQELFSTGKNIGLPSEYLMGIYRQIIETKHKGNAAKLARNLMLLDLDPLPLYSVKDCIELKAQGAIDDFDFSLKVNFLNFINRFEANNTVITQFGINLDYWKRIEVIRNQLYLYNKETIEEKKSRKKTEPQNTPGGEE